MAKSKKKNQIDPERRLGICAAIKSDYPDRVPVILERRRGLERGLFGPTRSKFLAPKGSSLSSVIRALARYIPVARGDATESGVAADHYDGDELLWWAGGKPLRASTMENATMERIARKKADPLDGFIYVRRCRLSLSALLLLPFHLPPLSTCPRFPLSLHLYPRSSSLALFASRLDQVQSCF